MYPRAVEEKLKGRVADVGGTRGIGSDIGRSVASRLGQLGQPDEAGRVEHFVCADASSYSTGQVWAANSGHEM